MGAGELYRAHARFVASFLLRLGAPPDEMQDLTQEVFLVAHRRGGFTPGAAKATTWLGEIAVRVWSNRKRTARRRPAQPAGDLAQEVAGHFLDPEASASERESLARVQRCLETLDLDHRAVFVLYELEGAKCADIAAALEVVGQHGCSDACPLRGYLEHKAEIGVDGSYAIEDRTEIFSHSGTVRALADDVQDLLVDVIGPRR